MRNWKRFITAAAVGIVTACAASGVQSGGTESNAAVTGTVRVTGRVTARDGAPVANARVYVPGTGEATRTDANGNYALAGVPGGPQTIVVRRSGYAPVRTEAKLSTKPSDRERNHIDVTLLTLGEAQADATQRAGDLADLARTGFTRRQSTVRGGYFIGPDDIAQMHPARVSDIFRNVPVVFESPGPYGTVLRGAQGCLATFVDGLPWRSMFPGDLDTDIPASEVVAVEVYPPGQTPPVPFVRGNVRSNCTTVGIWTRSALG
jgi:hypothetical protein